MMASARQVGSIVGGAMTPTGRARAVVLLEVVISLALFAAGATVVTGVIGKCQLAVERIRIADTLTNLAYSRLSELPIGIVAPDEVEDEPYEESWLADYRWSLTISPLDAGDPALGNTRRVTVMVRHLPTGLQRRMTELLDPP